VMAYLGRPGSIWDEAKPWRTVTARVIHLGNQRGESGFGSLIPTARAAQDHWVKGDAHAEGGRGDRNERGEFLTTPGYCNGRWRLGIEASGENRGSAEARSMAAAPIRGRCSGVGSRGKRVGEGDAAEGECEEVVAAKKGGRSSACGSCDQRNSRSSRVVATRSNPSAVASRRIQAEGLGPRTARLSAAQEERARDAVARGHIQRPRGRTGGNRTEETARGGKKHLTGGTDLAAEGKRESGRGRLLV
jgi:hypothetical protein